MSEPNCADPILQLEGGRAKVVDVNFVSGVITLQTEDEVQLHVPASTLNLQGLCRRHGIACTMSEPHCEALRADPDANEHVPDEPGEADDIDADAPDTEPEPGTAVAIARPKSEVQREARTTGNNPAPGNGASAPNNRSGRSNRNNRWRGRRPNGPQDNGGEQK